MIPNSVVLRPGDIVTLEFEEVTYAWTLVSYDMKDNVWMVQTKGHPPYPFNASTIRRACTLAVTKPKALKNALDSLESV